MLYKVRQFVCVNFKVLWIYHAILSLPVFLCLLSELFRHHLLLLHQPFLLLPKSKLYIINSSFKQAHKIHKTKENTIKMKYKLLLLLLNYYYCCCCCHCYYHLYYYYKNENKSTIKMKYKLLLFLPYLLLLLLLSLLLSFVLLL